MKRPMSHGELLALKRWNTPTIANGWEQISRRDPLDNVFNLEETTDFAPQLGPMAGYAVTVVLEPGNPAHKRVADAYERYLEYIAAEPGPKIIVAQDLDKPRCWGAFWGEVQANTHRALGCVGTITDGAVRDLDEMRNAGFKPIARRLCVSHAHAYPVRWGCEVEAFGCRVRPGQVVHADKHGFFVVPEGDEGRLVEAVAAMDRLECETVIAAARDARVRGAGLVAQIIEASRRFDAGAAERFGRKDPAGL